MERATAEAFVEHWLEGWNTHDIEAVLGHFADDAEFTSPYAGRLVEGSDGVVRGKEALRSYWRTAMGLVPDLHFELLGVYVGVATIVINYRNQRGGLVNEVLTFTDGRVTTGHGTYLETRSQLQGPPTSAG